jgi:hypothetical protein
VLAAPVLGGATPGVEVLVDDALGVGVLMA